MTKRHWIAVASAEHVTLGRTLGFMQVCHGKAAPLRRLRFGDRVIYYSPERRIHSKDGLQAFTAIGLIKAEYPYMATMSDDFHPWRRNVLWHDSIETPIRPLLNQLAFTKRNRNWGYQFRYGLFEIDAADADIIEAAMRTP